jgi:hypothetical protein
MLVPLSSDVILEILIRLTRYLRLRELLKLYIWLLQDACWLLSNLSSQSYESNYGKDI